MEQFSHDLTIALEETSRSGGVRAGRWGLRRRTRSTGNLPCAPQPTEDSSSSPADGATNNYNAADGGVNSILSDSDDRQELKLSLKSRQSCLFGNFESDSLNENFSPARPNTRRKRKFKRMAVEYETTTPSTPGNTNPASLFPVAGTVKKRVLKHTSQENFRANIFFCGKRKRSHRDRYFEQHSSSVPRQRDFFTPKNSYMEYRSRNRSFSKPCERIMPLNKSIVSKIEKISQDSRNKISGFQFLCLQDKDPAKIDTKDLPVTATALATPSQSDMLHKLAQKSGSFDSSFKTIDTSVFTTGRGVSGSDVSGIASGSDKTKEHHHHHHHHHHHQKKHHKHSRRHALKMQLQFEDPNGMDCAGFNEFLSSSSLSSSDSEAGQTNESDREGDDELTDWPGNEAMVNFTSKNDFKRAKPRSTKPTLPQIKSEEMGQDDDTLMSADELLLPPYNHPIGTAATATSTTPGYPPLSTEHVSPQPSSLNLSARYSPAAASLADIIPLTSMPIDILENASLGCRRAGGGDGGGGAGGGVIAGGGGGGVGGSGVSSSHHRPQIESEMSGETSNHFLSSSHLNEVREIRAGCRRIRNERPGFRILTSVNEELSRFLQDARQEQLMLPDTDAQEHEKLLNLAKLYSLNMHVENGCAILTKTSNTTQTVKIDQTSITKRFLGDYKRRCYGGEYDDPESSGMAS